MTVLGTKKRVVPDGAINLTGGTTLEEALAMVRYSNLVIGPDGLLTYYSTIHGTPTTIIFHEEPLARSYCVHDLSHATANALIHGGYVHDAQTLISLARELV
jgi:ADP-heptose:LPS heptosyltransferase